jgi:hypothetical protein
VAQSHYAESLALFRELGDKSGIVYPLEGFAGLAAAEGDPQRAVRLYGAAEALRQAISLPMAPPGRAMNAPYIEAARSVLGEEAFAAAWAEGRALALEEASACALEAPGPARLDAGRPPEAGE